MRIESVYIPRMEKYATYHIGQHAKDNFAVIDSSMSREDIWFHAQHDSSCHVLCLVPPGIDKAIRKSLVKQGALLCKTHTAKLRCEKNVPIIYAEIENVKKTHVEGQVSIEGKYKTVII